MSNQQTELSAPTTSIVNVTPDQAATWLAEHNVHNRTLRETRVAQYARDMEADCWQFNGDPIRFAMDGSLLDGQHRLSAVMRSGKTVPMVVIWGLTTSAQETMDIGAARSMADALSLRGEQAAKYLAAISRRLVQYDRGINTEGGYQSPSFAEMHKFIDNNPDIRRAVEVAQRAASGRLPVPPSSVGAAYFVCARRNVPSAETFYLTQLIDCIGLRDGDPARALLRRFQNENLAGRQMHPDDVFRYSIQAWNHFRAGNSITKLQAPQGGWGPKNMPVPR